MREHWRNGHFYETRQSGAVCCLSHVNIKKSQVKIEIQLVGDERCGEKIPPHGGIPTVIPSCQFIIIMMIMINTVLLPFPLLISFYYCTSYLNRKNWLLVNEVDFHDFYAFVLLHFFLKILICYFSCKKSSCAFSLNPVKKVGHGRFVYCFIKLIFWAQEKNLDLL